MPFLYKFSLKDFSKRKIFILETLFYFLNQSTVVLSLFAYAQNIRFVNLKTTKNVHN